jgi:hypothetical protein
MEQQCQHCLGLQRKDIPEVLRRDFHLENHDGGPTKEVICIPTSVEELVTGREASMIAERLLGCKHRTDRCTESTEGKTVWGAKGMRRVCAEVLLQASCSTRQAWFRYTWSGHEIALFPTHWCTGTMQVCIHP